MQEVIHYPRVRPRLLVAGDDGDEYHLPWFVVASSLLTLGKVASVARALAYLHQQYFVHGDVSPVRKRNVVTHCV